MSRISFSNNAWDDYLWWQTQDKKTLKRIHVLLKDIERSPYDGIGKPEALSGDLSGQWSRRIDEKNRLVYKVNGDYIDVDQCKTHYEDK
ncbi:MAG: Txe/YoeB family addiction module toxin [Clostridiales Family XIII bacterium]|jgi:toxin YoeB|nr:Txe/YoeB family addiction module toxin [Clostridiales Family XIII bacterium]